MCLIQYATCGSNVLLADHGRMVVRGLWRPKWLCVEGRRTNFNGERCLPPSQLMGVKSSQVDQVILRSECETLSVALCAASATNAFIRFTQFLEQKSKN